jgi:hypothetical protein
MSHKEISIEQMQSFVRTFSDFTNAIGHDHDGKLSDAFVDAFFQEHRFLQGEMLQFVYKLLGKIGQRADSKMWTDPRNEYWVSWAKWANKINSKGEL